MKCPTCTREFHPQPDSRYAYYFDEQQSDEIYKGFGITVQLCPSCNNMIVIYQEGEVVEHGSMVVVDEVETERIIFPEFARKVLPTEIPQDYRDELNEAYIILSYSPKASAALSRRLLQRIFHERMGIKKKDLSKEIDAFIETAGAPTYLREAIDAVRNIGNFAAHPLKNTNTGEIVDVEAGEAEWLLEVLEALYDFIFVQPEKLRLRRESLNKKLSEMGKPELKGS